MSRIALLTMIAGVRCYAVASARTAAITLVLAVSACQLDREPSYIRISGPAPVIENVPATRALLVVFWASWCVPCREEAPQLLDLAGNLPDGLGIVTFSHDTSLVDAERYFGRGADGSLNLRLDPGHAVARAFGVEVLPASILVVNGRLAARFNGPRQWHSSGMRRLLHRLSAEDPAEMR